MIRNSLKSIIEMWVIALINLRKYEGMGRELNHRTGAADPLQESILFGSKVSVQNVNNLNFE